MRSLFLLFWKKIDYFRTNGPSVSKIVWNNWVMCYIKNEKSIMGEKWMNTVVFAVMGSTSDWETMKEACIILDEFGIAYEKRKSFRHTPDAWSDVHFCGTSTGCGNESHHCRRGRRSAPSGHDCRENDASGHRCSGPIARFWAEWILCCPSSRCPVVFRLRR